MMDLPKDIVTVETPDGERFLRQKTKPVSFGPRGEMTVDGQTLTSREVSTLVLHMRRVMKDAIGIGLAANQIGLPWRLFVAQVPVPGGDGEKFYAVFNPEIEKADGGKATVEEGCLSVPGKFGELDRTEKIVLRGLDKRGKPLKVKAWGLLAQVFQHETDHLDGKLYIDKAKQVFERQDKSDPPSSRDRDYGRAGKG